MCKLSGSFAYVYAPIIHFNWILIWTVLNHAKQQRGWERWGGGGVSHVVTSSDQDPSENGRRIEDVAPWKQHCSAPDVSETQRNGNRWIVEQQEAKPAQSDEPFESRKWSSAA